MHRRSPRVLIPASLLLALTAGGCFKNDDGDTGGDDSDATLGSSSAAASTGGAAGTGDDTTAATAEPTGTSSTDPTTAPTTDPTTGGETTGPPAEGCEGYCTLIETNCGGPFTQYGSPDMCLGACAAFAAGTPGETSGNTLACRTYHAGVAAGANDIHCTHAGPGGDMACGSNCEGFCAIAGNACPDAWPDNDACIVACTGFDATEPYDASDIGGNTLACRLYHLTAATIDPTTHCAHIKGDSAPCQ